MTRTTADLLAELETANDGAGPDPIASYQGAVVADIVAAIDARAKAQTDIDKAVSRARMSGASWTTIGAALGVSRQAAFKRYQHA